VSANGQRKTKGILTYSSLIEQAVFDFQRAEYPHRPPDVIAPLWRWMFVESAARLGVEPSVWLYLKDGAVVAHQGAIPVRLYASGEEYETGWFVETMAAKSVRGSAIGPMLVKKALEDMPLNLSLGQTEQMRELQLALGWRQVCSVANYLMISGPRMSLRHKLPPVVAEIVAFSLGIFFAIVVRLKRGARRAGFHFRPLPRFAAEHDELWQRMAKTCVCASVRDASYMNWKYIDRPSGALKCIEMRDANGVVSGVSVVMLKQPNGVYDYVRGFLVDLVVPLDRDDDVSLLICESVRVLKKIGAQTVTCHVASPAVGAAMRRLGFLSREPKYHFLISTGKTNRPDASVLLDSTSWFLTLGDSDADLYAD
jgi:hypothetical protein